MARPAVGHFRDRPAADRAYEELVRSGVAHDDISIMGRGAEGKAGLADTTEDVSAGQGAVTGGIFGLLLGAAAMLIPGIGPVVAIGPISAALAGALTGGVTGAVVGGITAGLVHLGVPEEEARYHDERFKAGGFLVTVQTDDARYNDVRRILQAQGADMHGQTAPAETTTEAAAVERPGIATEGTQRVQLREEELRARKQTVEAGEVALRKDVVTEQKSMDVPVTHEEVVIERRPVDRRPADSADLGKGREEIRVPVREEQVRLDKQTMVTEEVSIGKQQVQETEHVAGTVRKEVARVEETGDVDVRGNAGAGTRSAAGDWAAVMPTYRSTWEKRYGTSGGRWEEYEPSYRYGHEMRNDPRFRGRSWTEAEPELRRDWESRHADMPWDKAGRAIRETWEAATTR